MSKSDDELCALAAQIMGMKLSEVVAAVDTPDGVVATTHDGKHTLIRGDGSMEFDVEAPAHREPEPTPPQTPTPPPVVVVNPDAVPDGSATDVLAWVNAVEGDARLDRAARAVEAENAREKPRATLIKDLEKVRQ